MAGIPAFAAGQRTWRTQYAFVRHWQKAKRKDTLRVNLDAKTSERTTRAAAFWPGHIISLVGEAGMPAVRGRHVSLESRGELKAV